MTNDALNESSRQVARDFVLDNSRDLPDGTSSKHEKNRSSGDVGILITASRNRLVGSQIAPSNAEKCKIL
jgi:hypothetical protein